MDAVIGHECNGPTAGQPHPVGALLMSTDPLALDAVACRMMGTAAEQVKMLVQARAAGLGTLNLAEIELAGDYDEIPVVRGWKLPDSRGHMRGPGWMLGATIGFLRSRPVISRSRCRDCGMCVESCPVKAIERATKRIDYAACIGCLCCHELCRHEAVELKRVNPLAELIMRRRKDA